jgi:uncharacterized protein
MKSFLFIILLTLCNLCEAQQLPRRVYLGIRMENLTEDAKRIMGLPSSGGVLIADVLPQSTAEQAGFKKGDILLSIDSGTFNSTGEVFSVLAQKKVGTPFRYQLMRQKKKISGKSTFRAFPEEKYPDLEVIYSETSSEIGFQRIIITKPKTSKKLPVVVFIGGIGCYSLDFPMDSNRNELRLLNGLSRAGYVCARLEKPGIGDNTNYSKACNKVSFMEETQGYANAIRTLKQRADVDSNAIFIIGHSMGGVFAPLIAQKTSIKGIVAYGTIGSNFIEYLAKTRRTIAEAYAMSPEETDQLVKDFCECGALYFSSGMTTAESAAKKPICGEYLSIFDLRSRAYNDELYGLNIPAIWKPFTGNALLVWGESDYISAKDDHSIIASAINHYHAGHAEFITVGKADHGMSVAGDFQEAARNPGGYQEEVGKVILTWLKKQA